MIADVSSKVADNAMLMLAPDAPPLRRVTLRAGRRDSVASVAKRYRLSAAQVAQWNDVGTGASFAPGKTIVVYVAHSARHGSPSSASTRSASRHASHGTRRNQVAATAHAKGGRSGRAVATHKHVVARY
jgi:membrane-bound lytic murein transglycosylase D